MYINVNICLDTVQTRLCMFTTTLHFPSRPNLPDQPCDAGGESQLRAGAAPSELPSSWHQSFQSTDHPGAACHAQTATATVSPRTHCCQACHPLLQCHSCPKNTGKPDLWPLVLAILVRTYQPGLRGSVELYPPCWDNWLRYVCTLHKRVHTVYIHVHTLYISTTYCMHIPLLWLPLHTRL